MEFSKVVSMMMVAGALTGCGSTEIREAPLAETPSAPSGDLHALSFGETNRTVGDVSLRNDANTLFITVTAFEGTTLEDVRVCLGVSAFFYVNPAQCSYTAQLAPNVSKGTVAISLSDLGEPVAGQTIYVQAAAAVADASNAKGFAYAGTFKGRVGYTVAGSDLPASGACVLSVDEWAGAKRDWPVASITIGGNEYRHDELLDLLATPSAGDASLLLAKQVIAARLNVAMGASAPMGVADALAAMESWFPANADLDGSLPFHIAASAEGVPNSEAFDVSVNTAEMIRQFNAGKLSAPRCE